MTDIRRREFLKRGAAAFAGGSLSLAGHPLLAAVEQPHLSFPAEPRARLAVASYPFREFMNTPRDRPYPAQRPLMDLPAFARMVVGRFRLRAIEPLSAHFASRDTAYLETLRRQFRQAGVKVVDIPVGMRQSFYDPDAGRRSQAIEAGKQWVDVALTIGSPSIRVHIERAGQAPPDVARASDSLSKLADYGAQRNVIINLENDDLVSEDAFFIVRVLDRVQHPYLRALPDFGNSAASGNPVFNLDALTLMFRHAYNISHMKDSEAGDDGRIYQADVPATFRLARAAGYRGYFSMEWDRPGDPYAGTSRLIAESLEALGGS